MLIRDILSERDIVLDVLAPDKAAVLVRAATLLARATGGDQQTIGEALAAREATGSTGFGSGIAIPHALVAGISAPTACLLLLNQPVAYEAIDDRPVDIAFGLLWPKHETRGFLPGLAQIARVLRLGPVGADVDVDRISQQQQTVGSVGGDLVPNRLLREHGGRHAGSEGQLHGRCS